VTLRHNVILTGGWAHDFAATAPVLADVLERGGFSSVVVADLEQAARELDRSDAALLTVYACQFQMLDDRYTEENRAEWARTTTPDGRAGVERFLQRGGGVLAVHTASICFDDWPRWQDVLGGGWTWGRSWHPPPQAVPVEPVTEHPIVDGVAPFTVMDERYCDLAIDPSSRMLLRSPGDDGGQPVLWVHEAGPSRVVYDALGHDERSLAAIEHATLLRRAARWAVGEDDASVRASA
jgi:type 1 glutamine amidotransferase